MDLIPDVDYAAVAPAASAQLDEPEALAEHLSAAWAAAYRSRIPQSFLLEFDSDGARFLFDLASDIGAVQADRTLAAWGRSRPASRPRDVSYQRGYPSPQGRAVRRLDKGHMVAHAAGGTFGPNMFPQDRDLNRGWSAEGRRYRAWNGRSPPRRGRSSSAACCMPTTATSQRRSTWACSARKNCMLSGSATASTYD